MRTFLYIFIGIIYVQGFGQDIIPNTTQLPTSTTSDYALINDYQGIIFDKEKSRVSFDFIEDKTSGTIAGLDFKINFNPQDPENATFKGTALITTLDTDNFLRDGHLMWEKFFYRKKYPKISFTSTHVVSFDKNIYKVIGNLTIKGIQKEIILTFSLDDKKLLGKTTIHTSDFGVNIHDEREKNKLDIRFYFPILQ
ncbi:polyisoprenoid-binding protein YceI [Aquimarina sp. MAR_2010_214]|uniref:YceI family protein n=1 Tax=Aquimarina sp. MAR_2010_214 TaxID=1250026 RepID=UPI000C70F8D5|nr:YceI family protein [Aquimarina sp. MAR_2010_214]PKV51332.1 polyisoprenoid-binding protein YceI [Aquimarina sp. MAR_2010_214]